MQNTPENSTPVPQHHPVEPPPVAQACPELTPPIDPWPFSTPAKTSPPVVQPSAPEPEPASNPHFESFDASLEPFPSRTPPQDIPLIPNDDIHLAIQTSPTDGTSSIEPGLISMLMLDSPNPGQIRPIQVRGNAALMGPNGAGKTSVIKAALLFSGIQPHRISTGEGKSKFLDHYFQRETSILVYCYANSQGAERLLAHFKTAEGLRSRFFRCGMREDLFIRNEHGFSSFVKATDLRARAAELGIPCSNSIHQADAQKALNGFSTHSTEERQRFGLGLSASDVSLAPSGARLGDLSEICKAVEERKSTLPQLAETAARAAMEAAKLSAIGNPDLALEMQINPILASLLPNMRGVASAKEARVEYQKAAEAHSAVISALAWRRAAREAFGQQASSHDQLRQGSEARLAMARTTFETSSAQLDESIATQRNNARSDSALAKDMLKRAVDKKTEGERLRASKAPFWLAKQAERGFVQENIRRVLDELTQLEGKSSEAAAGYRSRHLVEHESQANLDKDAIRQEESQAEQDASARALSISIELETQMKALDEERKPFGDAFAEKHAQAREVHAFDKRLAQKPAIPDDAIAALRSAQDQLSLNQDALAQSTQNLAAAGAFELARADLFDKAREDLSKTKEAQRDCEDQLLKVQQWSNPHPDSPLASIRKEASPIAAPLLAAFSERALLEGRVDNLGEAFCDPSGQWLGLSIGLDSLLSTPSGALVRESSIEHAEAKARKAYDAAAEREALARKKLNALDTELRTAKTLKGAAEKKQRLDKEALDIARAGKVDKEAALAKAARLAQEDAQRRAGESKAALDDSASALETFRREHERLRKGIKSALGAQSIQAAQAKATRLAELKKRREIIDSNLASQKDSVEQLIQADLARNGVSFDMLRNKRRELDNEQKSFADIEKNAALAQGWKHWTESTQPSLLDDEQSARDLIDSAQEHDLQASALEATLHASRESHRQHTASLQNEIDSLSNLRRLCLEQLAELSMAGSGETEPALAALLGALQTPTLIQQHNAKSEELRKAREDRSRSLAKCHEAFRLHPRSPPDDFWQGRKNDEPATGGSDDKEAFWTDAYRVWHEEGAGDQQGKALASQAESFGSQAFEFHRRLGVFKLECARVGRDIGSGLKAAAENASEGGNRFKSISNLKVFVECDLETLPFFQALSNASKEHEDWQDSKEPTPPDTLLKTFSALMEHARSEGVLRAELASLVGISGSVTEVGVHRRFSTKQGLSNLSSNGLSYLIVLMVQLAFLNQARARCPNTRVTWAIDELRELDNQNSLALFELLRENKVDLICAFPEPDAEILDQVAHIYIGATDGTILEMIPANALSKNDRSRRRAALAIAQAKQAAESEPLPEPSPATDTAQAIESATANPQEISI